VSTVPRAPERGEHPVWFGAPSRPLFGWLATPRDGQARGGVLLAPPIGREARGARRALRRTALALADRGFVSLRFDYRGTGDASGDLDELDLDTAWTDSVARAVELLRSCELDSVSAIGMRLGATIVGAAADASDLGLTSLVLWDPCDSGRSYLRELGALESLRRERADVPSDGSVETAEFVFSSSAADAIRRLRLTSLERSPLAERLLVLVRPDRPLPEQLRRRLEREHAEFEVAADQAPLLDVDPLHAVLPLHSMERVADWLSSSRAVRAAFKEPLGTRSSVILTDEPVAVAERTVQLGANRLFGIVTEPIEAVRGPLVVFLNVSNEEHTGPSRLWVELARRWAAAGLQCVRFDLTGLGDSPWRRGQPEPAMYDERWLGDMSDVARALRPDDPSDTVFVGLCSGAYLAVEGALALGSKGVCAINPPIGIDFLYGTARMAESRHGPARALAVRLKELALRLRWVSVVVLKACRVIMPSMYGVDALAKVVASGADLYVLSTSEDLSPYKSSRRFDMFFSRRLLAPSNYVVQFVDGLDHSMHAADGRARAIALLDGHVLTRYATPPTVATDAPADDPPSDGPPSEYEERG
jgi:alpha-beta hydrolase superfamily lysophospholipase